MKTVTLVPPEPFTEFSDPVAVAVVDAMSFWSHARPGRSVRIEQHGIGPLNRHGYHYRHEWLVRFTGRCYYSGEIESWECTDVHFLMAASRIIEGMSALGEPMFRGNTWSAVDATLGYMETESVMATEPGC